MSENEKNVPKRRFKEFENAEAWEQRMLGEVLTERKILQKISDDAPVLAFAAGQGVIDRSERRSNNRDHLTLDPTNKFYLLTEYNDIVYNPSNLKYGAIDRNKHGKGVISPIYVTFTTEEEASFIELIVKSEKFKLRALQFEEGTVVKRQSVKPENLLTLYVKISPSRDEQKKIGALFEYLDNLITLHQRKLDKMKALKKAYLTDMFPTEGERKPKLRFDGFTDDWEQRKLGEVATIRTGYPFDSNDFDDKGEYLVITNGNIQNDSPTVDSSLGSRINFNNATLSEYVLNPNDILVTMDGTVGRTAKVVEQKQILAQRVGRLTAKSDPEFLYQFLNTGEFFKKMALISHGGIIKHISLNEISSYISCMPPSSEEQTKIGKFFKSVDNLIILHQRKLEKLQNIKKAYLNEMFI